jgi:hypothetical protein
LGGYEACQILLVKDKKFLRRLNIRTSEELYKGY